MEHLDKDKEYSVLCPQGMSMDYLDKFFNAGIMEFPKLLLDNDDNDNAISKVNRALKSLLWSDGGTYTNEELIIHNLEKLIKNGMLR